MKLLLVSLALLGMSWTRLQEAPPARSGGVASVTYVLAVDPARVRAVEWVAKDASVADALAGAARVIERRFAAMERSARTTADAAHLRIEVAMPQIQPADRENVAQMLGSLGLCEVLVVAEPESVAELGVDLEAETKELESWRKSNPARPLVEFRAAGTPPRLVWFETQFAAEKGAPMPVLL